MTEIYRDAQHAARERIAALERDIADKQPLLTPFVRAELPEALRARLDLLTELPVEQDPLRRADDLSAHLAALEQALDLLPALREELLALPSVERLKLPTPAQAGGPGAGLYPSSELRQITPVLELLDPEATIWVDGNRDYAAICATLSVEQQPLGLVQTCRRRVLVDSNSQRGGGSVEQIHRVADGQAWTRLARGTPPLEAYPQGYKENLLLKPLGLRRDAAVGDAAVDGAFMFDAEEDVARALIGARVGAGLLAASGVAARVCLSVEASGVATLTWEEGKVGSTLGHALVEVLVGLRQAEIGPLLDARGLAAL